MPANVRPPYDAELAAALAIVNDQLPATITPDMIEAMRAAPARATDLSVLLAEAADAASRPHPDVAALDALAADRAGIPTLDALIRAGTARAAAAELGLHHSTVQSRLAVAAAGLGYGPRTPDGRTRYVLARTLQRLRNTPSL
jgi:DNA-binding PucR family transcriptional regulator